MFGKCLQSKSNYVKFDPCQLLYLIKFSPGQSKVQFSLVTERQFTTDTNISVISQLICTILFPSCEQSAQSWVWCRGIKPIYSRFINPYVISSRTGKPVADFKKCNSDLFQMHKIRLFSLHLYWLWDQLRCSVTEILLSCLS